MNERVAISDLRSRIMVNSDTGEIFWVSTGRPAGSRRPDGYIRLNVSGATVMAHRAIWAWVNGAWPRLFLDHIDGNRQNNSISNLREVTEAESQKNLGVYKTNKSGFPGVYWSKANSRWMATVQINRRRVYVGCFVSAHEAFEARLKAQMAANYHPNHGSRPSWEASS